MITRIQISNLKGQEADRLLGPLTLIVGKNQVGKTALLDAVKIGLLGYHPSLGKRRQDTMLLASGDPMRVRLETTKGVFAGEWPAKGTVRESVPFSVPPVLLDLAEFHDKSGGQRLDMLLAAAGVSLDAQALVGKCASVRIENHGKEAQEALEKLTYDIAVRLGHGEEAKESPVNTLSVISVELASKVSQLREQVKNFEAQLKGQSEQTSAVAVQSRKEDIERLDAERQRLTTKLADLIRQITEGERWAKVRAQITETLARTEGIEERVLHAVEAAEQAGKEFQKAKEKVDADQAALDKARNTYFSAKSAVEYAVGSVTVAEGSLADATKRKQCPTCKHRFSKDEQSVMVADAKARVKDAITSRDFAEEVFSKAETERGRLQACLDESRKALEAANAALIKANGFLDYVRQERNNREAALEAQKELGVPVYVSAMRHEKDAYEKLMAQVTIDLMGARTEEAAYQREQGVRALREQTRLSAMEARISFAVAQGVQKAVADYKEGLVKSKITEALGVLRELGLKVLNRDLIFLDGDIGYLNHGRFVSSRTFSGIEQTVTQAALGLALAVNAPFRIMLMDELGRFEPGKKSHLFWAVKTLIASKLLDQFMGIDWQAPVDLDGITLVEV